MAKCVSIIIGISIVMVSPIIFRAICLSPMTINQFHATRTADAFFFFSRMAGAISWN